MSQCSNMDIIQALIDLGSVSGTEWHIGNNAGTFEILNNCSGDILFSILNDGTLATGSNFSTNPEFLNQYSNITIGTQFGNYTLTSNYVLSTSNILVRRILREDIYSSNYTKSTSNYLILKANENEANASNYILSTSNNLINKALENDRNASNYIMYSSNNLILKANFNDTNSSNYILTASNNLINKIRENDNNSSNYILTASNNLINNTLRTSNNLINKMIENDRNSSNYVLSTSNILAQRINKYSVWEPTTSNIYYYSYGNVGIGTTTPQNKLHICDTSSSNVRLTIQNNYLPIPNEIVVAGATSATIGTTERYISFPYTSDSSGLTGQTQYTFTTTANLVCDILLIGGGGGGGTGGGGGGGYVYMNNVSMGTGTYTVCVGKGGYNRGQSPLNGTNGYQSSISGGTLSNLIAYGGGGGWGHMDPESYNPGQIGSLGGVGVDSRFIQTETLLQQGNRGGNGAGSGNGAGGGGGAGTAGGDAVQFNTLYIGGLGGDGKLNDITGVPIYYAGGGNAGMDIFSVTDTGVQTQPLGGGGLGTRTPFIAFNTVSGHGGNGTNGLGGGAGGGTRSRYPTVQGGGGVGGSGIVIVRYRSASDTITSSIASASIELVRGLPADSNTDYKIGNFNGDFKIMSSASNVDTNRLLLTSNGTMTINGSILPAINSNYNLGSFANKWKDLYLSGDSIFLDNTVISSDKSSNINIKDTLGVYKNVNINNLQLNSSGRQIIFGVDTAGRLTYTASNITSYAISTASNLILTVDKGGTGVGTFASGQLLIGNGTSNVYQNTNLMWDNTTGNLGIGTSVPVNKLHICETTTSNVKLTIQNNYLPIPNEIVVAGTISAIIGTAERYISFPFTIDNTGAGQTQYTFTSTENLVCDILLVGGGGGGGTGGGGAGGYVYNTNISMNAGSYTVRVGNGSSQGNQGINSTISSSSINMVAYGGGAGGLTFTNAPSHTTGQVGSYGGNGTDMTSLQTFTSLQGNRGGSSIKTTPFGSGGGGGGADEIGGDSEYVTGVTAGSGIQYNKGGKGGNGKLNSITGTSIYYAGGGTGGTSTDSGTDTSIQIAPLGGGGLGSRAPEENGGDGTNGLGGGGGGSDWNKQGGRGGSGIVIIRYRFLATLSSSEISALSSASIELVRGLPADANTDYKLGNFNGDFKIMSSASNVDTNRLLLTSNGTMTINGSIEAPAYLSGGRNIVSDSSNYVLSASNLISQRITNLTTDMITENVNATKKFIVNNRYNNNLELNGTLTINSNLIVLGVGNVGIGTTNPSTYLHLYDEVIGDTKITIQNNSLVGGGNNYTATITPSGGTFTTGQITSSIDKFVIFTAGSSSFTVPAGGLNCDILMIGGGGGSQNPGGGAGACIVAINQTLPAGTCVVSVGDGGSSGYNTGSNGNDSFIKIDNADRYRAKGGGKGGLNQQSGNDGGCGGGGGYKSDTITIGGAATSTNVVNGSTNIGPSITSTYAVMGNAGGNTDGALAAGGGGIGTVGAYSGTGGNGAYQVTLTGAATPINFRNYFANGSTSFGVQDGTSGNYYIGGGGGGFNSGLKAGGLGGAGVPTESVIANTGSGAGMGNGAGGSGIVIIRYRIATLTLPILGNPSIELIRGIASDSNTDYKIGNYGGNFKIMSSTSNIDTNRVLLTSNGDMTLSGSLNASSFLLGGSNILIKVDDTSNYIRSASNIISQRITNLTTDMITENVNATKKFIINNSYNNNLELNGTLTINSNLIVLGDSTRLDTIVYTTERLEIINANNTATAFMVQQNSADRDIIVASNMSTAVFRVANNGDVLINGAISDTKLTIQNNSLVGGGNNFTAATTITPSGGTFTTGQITSSIDKFVIFTAGSSSFTVPAGGLNCDILMIGGGGGSQNAGGGAGACIVAINQTLSAGTCVVTVGDGGDSSSGNNGTGSNGNDSFIKIDNADRYRAKGGGRGGSNQQSGNDGGCGGGGGYKSSTITIGGAATSTNVVNGSTNIGPSITSTYAVIGNAGGNTEGVLAGGGGGIGTVGAYSGTGGNGAYQVTLTGAATPINFRNYFANSTSFGVQDGTSGNYYIGGGGGGYNSGFKAGGLGGGGGATESVIANTGSGAGSFNNNNKGASGIVIIRYRIATLTTPILGNPSIELIRGIASDSNTDYKIGNYGGDFKIMSSTSNIDTNRVILTSNGDMTLSGSLNASSFLLGGSNILIKVDDTSNYIRSASNIISQRITNLTTDMITESATKKFIINNSYNNNLELNGTLTINSNLIVLGDSTRLDTIVYITERLEVVNANNTTTALMVQQNSADRDIFVASNMSATVFKIANNGDVHIKGNYNKNNRDVIWDTSNYVLTASNNLILRANAIDAYLSNYVQTASNNLELNSISNDAKISILCNTILAVVTVNDTNASNYVLSSSNNLILKADMNDMNASNYVLTASNIISQRITNLTTDMITESATKKFIINNSYNNNLELNGTLTINSNLIVLGDSTRLDTIVYTTERLEVVNANNTTTALMVQQNSADRDIFVASNMSATVFKIANNGDVHINGNYNKNNRDVIQDTSNYILTTSNLLINYNNLINRPGLTQWIGNSNITYNLGNVGIGTTVPLERLHVVGDIVATNNITSYYSDERLKTKTGGIYEPLEIVGKLNGFYYTPNALANLYGITNTDTEIGLSAQDVQRVLPEIVNIAPFDLARDADDNKVSKSGENYLTISYERLAPVFVEAIKELKNEIYLLKQRVAVLEK